jgi:hypothetical protein
LDPQNDDVTDGSVWADLRARRAEQARASHARADGADLAAARRPPRVDPGTSGKLLEHEVAATVEMAEDLAGWARAKALDALRDAEAKVTEIQRRMNALAHELHEIVASVSAAMQSTTSPGGDSAVGLGGRIDVVKIPATEDVPQLAGEPSS